MAEAMEVVFIDPEAPSATGGGIRTYIRLALRLCRDNGVRAQVFTHNPDAYRDAAEAGDIVRIGRRAWLPFPLRGLAYRWFPAENVLFEHAAWIEKRLADDARPGRAVEFADFLGYGFFALRNRALRARCLVRIHTPAFLIPGNRRGARVAAAGLLSDWRERYCLDRAPSLAAPSAEFVRQKLPGLRRWRHVPNPLPPLLPESGENSLRSGRRRWREDLRNAARTAGISAARPLPPSGDPAWSAARADEGSLAAAARYAARPGQILPARFLYLGRIEQRKGVLPLVRAFARVAAERPFAYLTLAGPESGDPYAETVRREISSMPASIRQRILREPPATPESRPELFARHTALVVPSLWENSPYVFFEGLAAGLECIGSATGEMKALGAVLGLSTPAPGDEAQWAEALRRHCDGEDGTDTGVRVRSGAETRNEGTAGPTPEPDSSGTDFLRSRLENLRREAEAALFESWRAAAAAEPPA